MKAWTKIRKAYKIKNQQESIKILTIALTEFVLENVKREKYKKVKTIWEESLLFCDNIGISIDFAYDYLILPSKDKKYVTYYPSIEKLFKKTKDGEGVKVKTTIGRFLKKFSSISEEKIKKISEKFSILYGESKMYIVSSPEGWEVVYENGYGFTSCMVYNNSRSNLDERCFGKYHPARAYAHPENDLALAYIANKEWDGNDEDFRVYARSIINTKEKTYLKVYGNDSLVRLLESNGYTHDEKATNNQKLNKIVLNDNGYEQYVCPYLDGEMYNVEVFDSYLLISYSGYNPTSSGLLGIPWNCPHCGREHENREDYIIEVERYETTVCSDCINEEFAFGYIDSEEMDWIRRKEAIYISGNYYTKESAVEHGHVYLEEYGWIHKDNIVNTSRGIADFFDRDIVILDIEDKDGNKHAHFEDTVHLCNSKGDVLIIHKNTPVEKYDFFLKEDETSND